jgi:hypothetical protein
MTSHSQIVARRTHVTAINPLYLSEGNANSVPHYRTYNVEHMIVETPFTGIVGGVLCRRNDPNSQADHQDVIIDEKEICGLWLSWSVPTDNGKTKEIWAGLDVDLVRPVVERLLQGQDGIKPSVPQIRILDTVEFWPVGQVCILYRMNIHFRSDYLPLKVWEFRMT